MSESTIKLPVRYDHQVGAVKDANENSFAFLPASLGRKSEAIGNQIVTALNESDALRAVLIECRDRWDSADNGRCTSCDFGYRKFDTKGNVQECDNAECLSHRIRAALKGEQKDGE